MLECTAVAYIYIYIYIRRPLGVAKACEMSISFFNPPDPPYLGVLGGGGVVECDVTPPEP